VQFTGNPIEKFWPVARAGLAEETRLGIPGRGWKVLHPAPVGLPGKKKPEGLAEGSGEVGDDGVCGDDQVQVMDEGGGAGQIAILGRCIC